MLAIDQRQAARRLAGSEQVGIAAASIAGSRLSIDLSWTRPHEVSRSPVSMAIEVA